jgi:hypothetical protein
VPTETTYYAIVDDFSSRDRPGGVLRRVRDDNGRRDEVFSRNLAWEFTPLLYSYERGNGDNELFEITEAEANEIVARIRRTVTGGA